MDKAKFYSKSRNILHISFIVLLIILSITSILTVTACAGQKGAGRPDQIKIYSPAYNEKVNISNKTVQAWWDGYSKGTSLDHADKIEKTRPDPVILKWKYTSKKKTVFKVYITGSSDEDELLKYTTENKKLKVYNLQKNKKYIWWVTAETGKGGGSVKSDKSCFKTAASVRTIKISGVDNIRDIGGRKTYSGKRVKQGLIYRSANLNDIKKSGKTALINRLHVKTDLDLRRVDEDGAGYESPVGINYINISGKSYESIYETEEGRTALVKALRVFTEKKNYPIIFHCVAGRDRTGALAMILEGLLGVKKKDIFRDYELTYLSAYSGSQESAKERLKKFSKTYNYLAAYKNSDRSFKYNVSKFLTDNGMTESEINKIREIMLE